MDKPPGKNWARAFEKIHPELKARRVRSMDWKRHENNTYVKIIYWFEETGIMLSMLGSVKVLVSKDDLRGYRGAGVKRTTLIIWPASTPEWHFAHSNNGYNDSKISSEWLKRVFDLQTKERANQKPRILICNGFGTHETLEILEFCFNNNIVLCRLPSHTSHKLQPCDVGVFASLKTAYLDEVERLYRGGLDSVGKEHFTSLYMRARERALTKRNITAGWAASGLFPFNPDRVLRDTPKPLPELTVLNEVASCPQYEVLQKPVTPVTLVTTEALTSLYNLIEQETYTLDEPSKQRLQRHVQKLASAAQISFAKQTVLQDQSRSLSKMNNEAKARRSTRSVVLGTAKVMSYEDLEEAGAKRAAKEKATADKGTGKGGRKRKSPAPGEGSSVPTHNEELEPVKVPAPWRAPVARMY